MGTAAQRSQNRRQSGRPLQLGAAGAQPSHTKEKLLASPAARCMQENVTATLAGLPPPCMCTISLGEEPAGEAVLSGGLMEVGDPVMPPVPPVVPPVPPVEPPVPPVVPPVPPVVPPVPPVVPPPPVPVMDAVHHTGGHGMPGDEGWRKPGAAWQECGC